MTEQVDNTASVTAEVDEAVSNAVLESDSEDFFEAMDRQVNEAVYSIEEPIQETTSTEAVEASEASPEMEPNGEILKKRYGDSSREARRLNSRLKELEPYTPILDAMREDPNLITYVRNYFKGASGESPQSVKEELGVPDDFVFDADEAISDPESLSSAVLQRTVDGVVQRRLSAFAAKQKSDNQKLTRESDFRSKHSLDENEYQEVVDFAKNKTLALDDVYYLMNREKKEEAIADSARSEVVEQMKKVRSRPKTAAYVGSTESETSPDDSVFDAILGIDTELDNAFG